MSTIKYLFFILFLLVGCTEKTSPKKNPAVENSQYSYMGSVERAIDLKLYLNKAKVSVIKASFSVPYNYNSPLQYKWKLGPHVVAHQGALTGTIDSLQKDQAAEVTIAIKNFDSVEGRFIRFEVFGTDPVKRIFSDGIVSSHQDNSFESIVQEVEKNNAEK